VTAERETVVVGDSTPEIARERDERLRHSDVVPKDFSQVMAALRGLRDVREGVARHLSWPESGLQRMPDETRSAWMSAYEAGFDTAFATCERGDWLVPLVYAAGDNDVRFGRALVRFAYEAALDLDDAEAAFAVLEVADATLDGAIGKDLCARIAGNLVDEAYTRFAQDRQFDRYFFCHCAAAVARVAANIAQPSSARDAVEAIQSAVAAVRFHREDAEAVITRLAAKCIRQALDESRTTSPEDPRDPNRA
jgi:hypothetical protein